MDKMKLFWLPALRTLCTDRHDSTSAHRHTKCICSFCWLITN